MKERFHYMVSSIGDHTHLLSLFKLMFSLFGKYFIKMVYVTLVIKMQNIT